MNRLIVVDHYSNTSWAIDCPFDMDTSSESREWFRNRILETYLEFSDGKISVDYEDELNEIENINY
jgi:hypothetical protein